MNRELTPRQRVNQILQLSRDRRARVIAGDRGPIASRSDRKKLATVLARSVEIAFEKAGLDYENEGDRLWMLGFLAAAIFGRKAGHPKSWTKTKLRALLAKFNAEKAKEPNLTESRFCNTLVKNSESPLYFGLEGSTLRRRLQQAKRLGPKKSS